VIRIGFKADPDPTFISMRILIQEAKQKQIHAEFADPDPGQTLPPRKAEFLHEKYIMFVKKS
jgi:hypothetical protein